MDESTTWAGKLNAQGKQTASRKNFALAKRLNELGRRRKTQGHCLLSVAAHKPAYPAPYGIGEALCTVPFSDLQFRAFAGRNETRGALPMLSEVTA
jgi:hypothetical protein